MVFKGWAPGEAVGSLIQVACPALRQRLVQPGNMLVGGLSSGAVKQAFYSPLATTIACNISTIRDNRRGVAFRETAYIKGFASRRRTNPTDPVRSESSGGQKVAGSNPVAPTEIRCSAKTTCAPEGAYWPCRWRVDRQQDAPSRSCRYPLSAACVRASRPLSRWPLPFKLKTDNARNRSRHAGLTWP